MELFLFFLYFVCGLLGIIWFFKVWGACNNIKKMANKSETPGDFRKRFYELMLQDEKEEAFNLAKLRLASRMMEEYISGFGEYTTNESKTSSIVETLDALVACYKKYVDKTGCQLPDCLSSGKAFMDKMGEIKI